MAAKAVLESITAAAVAGAAALAGRCKAGGAGLKPRVDTMVADLVLRALPRLGDGAGPAR
jgi:hypothetical protein